MGNCCPKKKGKPKRNRAKLIEEKIDINFNDEIKTNTEKEKLIKEKQKPIKEEQKPIQDPPNKKLFSYPVSLDEELMNDFGSSATEIDTEGMCKLFQSLKLNPESDPEVLVFFYLCQSKQYGCLTRQELKKGLAALHVSNFSQWKKCVPKLSEYLLGNEDEYLPFHSFLFDYHLLLPGQRSLSKDTALSLLQIVVQKHYRICKKFIDFFQDYSTDKVTNDTWSNIPEVFQLFERKKYNPATFWPIIFDEFYKWLQVH